MIGIHVVRVGVFTVDGSSGARIDKSGNSATIKQLKNTEHRHLVIPADDVPNSANYPTVEAYLKAEALTDYMLQHMDQSMIVTYDQGGVNSAS